MTSTSRTGSTERLASIHQVKELLRAARVLRFAGVTVRTEGRQAWREWVARDASLSPSTSRQDRPMGQFSREWLRRFQERNRAEATAGELLRAELLGDSREENECKTCGGAQFFLVKTDPKRAGFPVTCECVPLSIRAAMAGIPERYRGSTFETFDAMPGKDEARARALAWDGTASVVLCGLWGVGKTHLACAMALSQIRKNRPVRFEDVKGFLDELKARFGTDQVQPYYERVADFPGVLVLDDLGAEQDGEWAEAQLRSLLNRRYSRRLTTVITTNLGHTAITNRIGGAVASRLSEWHWIVVEGVDVRPSLAAR